VEEITNSLLKSEFAFDQYGRYALIRDIIRVNRRNNEKFKILDVGGRGNILKKFLPDDDVFYVDPFVDSEDQNFIIGDGCALPLENDSFDWVTSADVFEHIPPTKRIKFLVENIRVARLGTILAAPFFSEEVKQAEINANESYKILSGGADHIWLKEHLKNGLPKENEVENYIKSTGLQFEKFNNNQLFLWETLIGICFNVSNNYTESIKDKFRKFNYFYNTEVYPFDSANPSYRKVYFIKKTINLKTPDFLNAPINDTLFLLTIKMGIDLVNTIDNENKTIIQKKDQELIGFNQAIQEKSAIIQHKDEELTILNQAIQEKANQIKRNEQLIFSLYNSYSWKFTKPFRWLHPRIFQLFYFFFPYGSVRWTIIKRMVQIIHRIIFRSPWRIVQTDTKTVNKNTTETLNLDIQKKPDKTKFYTSNSILFAGHDAYLAGAQVLLLSLIKWFSEHTGIVIKVILLRDGLLLGKFRNVAPTLIWEDLLKKFPDEEKRRKKLFEFIGKVDLIYGNTMVAPSIYDELKFLNVPYITHVHELEKSIKMYIDRTTIEKMLFFTKGYIAGSYPVEINLIKNHNIDEDKIITIHDFIEKREVNLNNSKKELRKKLGLIEDRLIIFGCGTIYWRKGVDLFIDTAIILKQKGFSDFHFYWIGENIWDSDKPSYKLIPWRYLEQKINVSGLRSHITFLGLKENFFDYFLAGDIFYLSSREDPFPLVCLEAAQCGMPIICFEDAGGMPNFVENDAGFSIPFEDVDKVVEKIIFLKWNPDILIKLGETARKKFLLRHSIDIAGPEILSFCHTIGNIPPVVSVIVPNYNCEKYLEKRLDSILNQTFKNFEIILLDDSSTDQSLDVIDKYLQYPNVTLYKNQSNSGNPFIQWHKGFLQTKGDIIWFAEADDYCEPDFLQKLLPYFNNPSVAIAYSDSLMIDESDSVVGAYSSYFDLVDSQHWKSSYQVTDIQEINFGLGVKNTIPNASAVLIRKSCISESIFNETIQFKFCGDWLFYTQVIKGKDIAFCSEKLNYHRKHDQTITSIFTLDKSTIQLLFKEQERIHEIILKSYPIDSDFLNKWQYNIKRQLQTWYPPIVEDEYNNVYPYNSTKEKIIIAIKKREQSKKLVFITTNDYSVNGGSEQLWRLAAIECKKRGHDVVVVIKKWDPAPFFMKDFYDVGIKIILKEPEHFYKVISFNADLIVISLGDQDEGTDWYECFRNNKIPYIIVNQLTKEPEYWPIRNDLTEQVKQGYLGAEMVLFTGKDNHEVMERRLNSKIPNAGIFYNPFDVARNTVIPYPPMDGGLKIAIPASLSRVHKGQHLAIELFNLKKWRERPIHLNLYGQGYDEDVLKKQARDFKMKNISFHGHTNNILAVWRENHAMFLPSFMEGLPLSLVGAMICARVPIITDIGAHREVIENNINGFLAAKPTVESLDEALERAYQQSTNWEEIGQRARQIILNFLPEDPIDNFINQIIPLASKKQ
jgi:glycosyltransferase involved in cell wall biosynthesis